MTKGVWDRVTPMANWWTFLILAVLIVAFQFAFKHFFLQHYRIDDRQLQTFDGRTWGFAPGDVDGILAKFKQIDKLGRYACQEATVDLIFPLVYGLAFCVAIVGLGRRLPDARCLLVVPVLAVIGDYIENFNAMAMALMYRSADHVPKAMTYIAAIASRIKWGLTLASAVVVLVLLILWPFTRSGAHAPTA